jgi:hypothetical protein
MARFFICQDPKCDSEHAYCHTCYREVCERAEADIHRSINHELSAIACRGKIRAPEPGLSAQSRAVAARGIH